MNGITEKDQLELDLIKALTGLNVSVVGGSIIGDTYSKPLSSEGAETVLQRLRYRGYIITKPAP